LHKDSDGADEDNDEHVKGENGKAWAMKQQKGYK